MADASVVLKWYLPHAEAGTEEALLVEARLLEGSLEVLAPSLLPLELLNAAGRRWGWASPDLEDLATALADSGISWSEPDLDRVAAWTGAGLTAYDAAYVAVAEQHDTQLVTADRDILKVCRRAVSVPTWAAGEKASG